VITFEEFGQEGKKEATASLKESLCRRKGQSVCTWFAALSIAWADFTLAVWNVGEWKGNPRFLGMYGVLFESFDGSHFFYMGFELGKKLVLAFFLVVPPSWGNVQLYGASAMQVLAVLTMVLRRPHSAYTDNLKDAVVQGSQALGSLAFLAGSLQLWQIPMPDIALFVMYSQIASVLYIVLVQVGDILKVLVQAFVSVGQAVVRASLAVASAVDAMRLARALQVDGAAAAHAVKIARAIKAVMANSVLIELEGEKLLTLAERTFRPAIDEQLKTALEGAGATRLAELLEGELAEAAEEVDTKYKSLAQIAGKSGKKGRRAAKQATAKGYGPAPSAAEAAPAAKAGRGGKKKTARVAPSPEKQPSLGRVRVEPPPSPPASPPAEYEQELASLANAKPEAVAEPPAPLRRRSSSGSARDLVRSLSKSSSFARLNGYDAEETYAPTVVMTPEVEAVVEAAEGGRPVQSAAEAAHTAAQGELVREEVAAQLQLPHGMRELLNAPHAEAAETMVEARWLATAGWRDRAELVAQRASSLAERAHGKDGGGATGEALLQGVLPSYAAVERAAIKETMVEVHEEDNEYAGGAKFLGSREEMREALARITLQKVEDATREASMRALERQMGGTVAAQSVQHVVVNAMMRKLQPRMQKLCDVKTAALLHYAAAAYLRLAEAAVPKQTSAGI
jgi:hypothetical protein